MTKKNYSLKEEIEYLSEIVEKKEVEISDFFENWKILSWKIKKEQPQLANSVESLDRELRFLRLKINIMQSDYKKLVALLNKKRELKKKLLN